MDTSDATVSDIGIQASPRLHPVKPPAAVSPVVQDNTLHDISQLHVGEVEECAFDQDSNRKPRWNPSPDQYHQLQFIINHFINTGFFLIFVAGSMPPCQQQ